MSHANRRADRQAQRGAVLFVALIFLLLLTLLGIAASSTSILQEKMTGSMRNRQLGLMGAESALRGGESTIWNLAYQSNGTLAMPPCIGDSTGVLCVHKILGGKLDSKVQAFRTSKTAIAASGDGAMAYSGAVTGLTGDNETASINSQPRFMIEDLGPDVPPGSGRRSGAIQQEKPGQPGSHEWYRITARSEGGNNTVLRVTESVFSALAPAAAGTP